MRHEEEEDEDEDGGDDEGEGGEHRRIFAALLAFSAEESFTSLFAPFTQEVREKQATHPPAAQHSPSDQEMRKLLIVTH
jgi:hypothetical protein